MAASWLQWAMRSSEMNVSGPPRRGAAAVERRHTWQFGRPPACWLATTMHRGFRQGPTIMGDIFISYRRSDSNHVAGRLYDRLARHFGENVVFKDVDNIPYGTDFRGAVLEAITRSQVVLAVIGDEWLDAVNAVGKRRLDDPSDYVRMEIEASLERPITVIPLLVGESPMPRPQDLPPTLQRLSFKNGMTIRPDPGFHRDVDRLIESLERLGLQANDDEARKKGGRVVQNPSHASAEAVPAEITTQTSQTVDIFELAKQTRERVETAHREARRLADVEHNFGESVAVLDKLPERLRDAAFYTSLVDRRDRVSSLDHHVREAVQYKELAGLRSKVDELFQLVPHREDLCRLREILAPGRGSFATSGSTRRSPSCCPPG